jgi:UPF0755 protein
MKSGNTVVIRIIIFIIVILIAIGGIWLWWSDGISPVDTQDKTAVNFIIKKGEGIKGISARLAQQNLIRSPTVFYILVKLNGIEKQIQAGDFRLIRSMDAETIAKELTHGMLDVWVTTLEGWRSEEIATKLTQELDIPEDEFLKYSREGYMFPDTYLIPREATAAAIAQLFMDNFNKKVTPEMLSQASRIGLKSNEVIILASIVEREGRSDEDRPLIAGILLNRLKIKQSLDVDATLQYALGYQADEKVWWKKNLTNDDKKINSPFNTYMNVGLPPHPISNPGLASIRAVLNPTISNYYYYLHDVKGQAHYAETLDQHTANISKYLHY